MRKYIYQLGLALLIVQILACNSINQKPVSANEDTARVADSLAILNTLDEWYNAMYRVDSIGVLASLTPQFLLLEDTIPLTGAELFARLKQGDKETKWAAKFSDLRTRYQGDIAWTTLKNHETSSGKDGKRCQADFLETIVFVRKDKRWLIDRYHAALVNQWDCEE